MMIFGWPAKIAILLLVCLLLMSGCGGQGSGAPSETAGGNESTAVTVPSDTFESQPAESMQPSEPARVSYTVSVLNQAGIPLDKIRVKIYPDHQMLDLVTMGNTDENGEFSFDAVPSETYVVVLQNVPNGYGVDTCYPFQGTDAQIVLAAVTLSDDNYASVKFAAGDPMPDFAITTGDGSDVMLSDLLQQNQVVVLNFWNLDCVPCKMEFPYLQSAYEQYEDRVAVVALDPFDSKTAIDQFQSQNGYTFTMTQCDIRLENVLSIAAHPTTLVVDRFGMITMIHTGSIPNEQPFLDIFEFFTADDYQHTVINDLDDIPA